MFKIDSAGHVANAFVEENPATGQMPTGVTAEWLNAVQGELTALVEANGGTLSKSDSQQAAKSLIDALRVQRHTAFTTTGTGSAYVVSTPAGGQAISVLTAGLRLRVKFHAASAASSTFYVVGTTTPALKQYDSSGAKVAAVVAANQLADVEFDGVDFVILDPLPASQSLKLRTSVTAITAADNNRILTVDTSAGNVSIQLPANMADFSFYIMNGNGSGIVTLNAPAGGYISNGGVSLGASIRLRPSEVAQLVATSATSYALLSNGLGANTTNKSGLTANDYVQTPSGLIFQWGVGTAMTAEGLQTITYPIAFPNAVLSVFPSCKGVDASSDGWMQLISMTTTSAVLRAQSAAAFSSSITPTYFVIGN